MINMMNYDLSTFIESYTNEHFPLIHSPPNLLMISYPPVLFWIPILSFSSKQFFLYPSLSFSYSQSPYLFFLSNLFLFSKFVSFQNLCILIRFIFLYIIFSLMGQYSIIERNLFSCWYKNCVFLIFFLFDSFTTMRLSLFCLFVCLTLAVQLKFNNGKFRIMQVTDTHISDSEEKDNNTISNLSKMLEYEKPDFVVITGDLISGMDILVSPSFLRIHVG